MLEAIGNIAGPNAELCVEPLYAELCAEPCVEPLYIELI